MLITLTIYTSLVAAGVVLGFFISKNNRSKVDR